MQRRWKLKVLTCGAISVRSKNSISRSQVDWLSYRSLLNAGLGSVSVPYGASSNGTGSRSKKDRACLGTGSPWYPKAAPINEIWYKLLILLARRSEQNCEHVYYWNTATISSVPRPLLLIMPHRSLRSSPAWNRHGAFLSAGGITAFILADSVAPRRVWAGFS